MVELGFRGNNNLFIYDIDLLSPKALKIIDVSLETAFGVRDGSVLSFHYPTDLLRFLLTLSEDTTILFL